MSDFYSRLEQYIVDRGISDAGARSEVYARARGAMIRRLGAQKPALATADIDRRVDAFDAAVERIEADLEAVFAEGENRLADDADGEPADVGELAGLALMDGEDDVDAWRPPGDDRGRGADDIARPRGDIDGGYRPLPSRGGMNAARAPVPMPRQAGDLDRDDGDDEPEHPRWRAPGRWSAGAAP
ncbi:MAG: hypothetical protein WD036_03625, partial [Bauldia sp.]